MYVVWRVSSPEVTRLISIFCIHLRISEQIFSNALQFLTTCLSPPPTQSSASSRILLVPFLEGEEWASVSFASWPVPPVSRVSGPARSAAAVVTARKAACGPATRAGITFSVFQDVLFSSGVVFAFAW